MTRRFRSSALTASDSLLFALALTLGPAPALAQALPDGGRVARGAAEIATPGPGRMVIDQSTDRAVIDWDGFSVGRGGQVDFRQPSAGSATLNRVTGSATSDIHGRITANGQVHLVNPNGVLIGPTGTVATGGFVASTLDTADDDFMAGRLRYRGTGASAPVANEGTVEIGRGGYAALIGGQVRNAGTISVPLGRIGLAAGERVTLDLSGDGFLQVAVPSGGGGTDALIEQAGTLSAEGGRIEMRAAAARGAARRAINLSGVAEARSVSGRSGAIVLGGGGGAVRVTGRVSTAARIEPPASSPRPPVRGGTIDVTGARIELAGAALDASGTAGGGRIRVGGDFGGRGTLARAETLRVDAGSVIAADAGASGDGGRIVLWSDAETYAAATLSARGGDASGDGGFVEVSSAGTLRYAGRTDTRAPAGAWGTLLLDPTDIVVFAPGTGAGTISEADLEEDLASNGRVELDTSPPGDEGSDPGDITIQAGVTVDWTSGATLALLADGDIVIDGAIDGPGGTLVVDAPGDGEEVFGTITTGPGGTVDVGTFVLRGGDWVQVAAALPAFAADDFRIDGGTFTRATSGDGTGAAPFVLVDAFGLQGVQGGTDYALGADVDAAGTAGWNGGDGFAPLLFDGSAASTFDGEGFVVDGLVVAGEEIDAGLFGRIGAEQVVTDIGLANASVSGLRAGLVAAVNEGVIQGARVTGDDFGDGAETGGVAGINRGTIDVVDVTANIGGTGAPTGGVAGRNEGTVSDTVVRDSSVLQILATDRSTPEGGPTGGAVGVNDATMIGVAVADTTVTGADGDTGGIAGTNRGAIVDVRADGGAVAARIGPDLFGDAGIGGAVGFNEGTLSVAEVRDADVDVEVATSFSNVSVGGAVGETGGGEVPVGLIETTAATGTVTVEVTAPADLEEAPLVSVGGLVGLVGFGTTTSEASADVGVSVFERAEGSADLIAGGFVGTNAGTVEDAYALGDVDLSPRSGGTVAGGGFVGDNLSDIRRAFSTGAVTSTISGTAVSIGGFAGRDGSEAPDASLFWDVERSGLAVSAAGTGLTTDQLRDTEGFVARAAPEGYDFEDTWAPGEPGFDPALYAVDRVVVLTPGPLTLTYGETRTASATGSVAGGPSRYVFDEPGDTLDASPAFGDLAFSTDEVGTGTFSVAAETLTSNDGVTYRIVAREAGLEITPAPLSVALGAPAVRTKTYGDTATFGVGDLAVTGLVFADDAVTGADVRSAGAAADAPAGAFYDVTISDLTGPGLSNYDVTTQDGRLEVERAPLDVAGPTRAKTYGEAVAFDADDLTVTGLRVAGDAVDAADIASDGAPADAPVAGSPYAVRVSNLGGTGLSNYDVTIRDGALTVDPAPLQVTGPAATKTYGEAVAFDVGDLTVTGLVVPGDAVTSAAVTSAGAPAGAPVAGSPYRVVAADIGGTGLGNYVVTVADGSLTVTPAPLEIVAPSATKTYGEAAEFDLADFVVRGFVRSSDTFDSLTIDSDGIPADAPVAGSPYAVTVTEVSGPDLANYDVALVDGEIVVRRAPATVIVDDALKLEGEEIVFDGTEFTTRGLLFDDAVLSADIASEGAAARARAEDAPFAITATGATGPGSANYDFTFEAGELDIASTSTPPRPVLLAELVPPPPVIAGLPDAVDRPVAVALESLPSAVSARRARARATLAEVEAITAALERELRACEAGPGVAGGALLCLSDFLGGLSTALDEISTDLPEGLENVASIIRTAQTRVDGARARAETRLAAATTDAERAAIEGEAVAEARAAVAAAGAEIRLAIDLVRADDPVLAETERATITRVSDALGTAEIELSRITEL